MHKTSKLTGFVDRLKELGLAVVFKPVDDYGTVEVYFIMEGELTLPSSENKVFEGRLYQFYASGESDSEKRARMAIQRKMAQLKEPTL